MGPFYLYAWSRSPHTHTYIMYQNPLKRLLGSSWSDVVEHKTMSAINQNPTIILLSKTSTQICLRGDNPKHFIHTLTTVTTHVCNQPSSNFEKLRMSTLCVCSCDVLLLKTSNGHAQNFTARGGTNRCIPSRSQTMFVFDEVVQGQFSNLCIWEPNAFLTHVALES